MDTNSSNVNLIKKKIVSGIFLTVFVLAFIFACLKNVLPVGKAIVSTFGILTYPMLIVLSIISLAGFLGFSYARSKKATVYFCMALLCVLLFIHSISTFAKLDAVVSGKSLVEYLNYSYTTKTTLTGSCGSLVCGLIAILLGAMGVVVLSVILATLFIGLFIDYQLYGKYEKPHVKKLKTRVLREKVQKSDKQKTAGGEPVYSFNMNENEVLDEIVADEDFMQSNASKNTPPMYSEDDVIGEISNEEISGGYQMSDSYQGYNENLSNYGVNQIQESTQTPNSFSDEFYTSETYPSVYGNDDDHSRREFMSATFGSSSAEAWQNFKDNQAALDSETSKTTFKPDMQEGEDNSSNSIFGGFSAKGFEEDSEEQDALSKILNSSDDDIASSVENDIFDRNSFDSSFGGAFNTNKFDTTIAQGETFGAVNGFCSSNNFGEVKEPEKVTLDNFEAKNAGFNLGNIQKPAQPQKPEISITSTHPISSIQPEKVVVPQKNIQKNPYGFNMSMPGVRYNPPPLSLLETPKPDKGDYTAEQNRKSAQLEQVLSAFNIPAKVENIVRGPKITRYELSVPLGVSVNKIPSYENDIARALCAKTVTIKAPIPGSPYVGIELENDTFTSVSLRELLESKEFQNSKDPLTVVIGKDISGEIVVKSLAKMVHMLVAGSTGSGKSVFIHTLILSLIFKYSPDDLRFVLVDPKKVEFNIYNGLPHLLTPEVVLGAEKALSALKWCVKEMDRRYDLMSKAGYNNIEPYNKSDLVKAGQFEKLPYIVIVVDEFAEIMVANKKEAEVCVQRITQLARACGMHLIIATQRPSVDVITGVIKNNIPSRVALSLQSGVDSKTIIGTVGAEKLLGQGDMIFAPTGTSAWPRLQGAYATDKEIRAIIDYDIKYNTANFDEAVAAAMNAEQAPAPDSVGGGSVFVDAAPTKDTIDPYFKIAVKHVMLNGGASVSYLQRRLSIGYSRAARIVDQMEDKGFIAPTTGAKLRKVLITPDQFREEFGEDYDSLD